VLLSKLGKPNNALIKGSLIVRLNIHYWVKDVPKSECLIVMMRIGF
jgi:hypothetical protein